MFKPVLDFLDKVSNDGLTERIEKEATSKKYWLALGGSVVFLFLAIIINISTMFMKKDIPPSPLISIPKKGDGYDLAGAKKVPVTLSTAHHTIKNLTKWLNTAMGETFTFGFANYESQIQKAEFYFTPSGYQSYLTALKVTGIIEDIREKQLEVSIVATQTPILINSGVFSGTEFWRFTTPVLVSVLGTKDPVVQNFILEVLIEKVPSHLNHKGIAISQYNLRTL